MWNKVKTIICGIFFIGLCFQLNAEEKKNKVVYLDLENEALSDMPFFAGLVIEDKSTKPTIYFEEKIPSPPHEEFELSPSLREYITVHNREIIKDTGPKDK